VLVSRGEIGPARLVGRRSHDGFGLLEIATRGGLGEAARLPSILPPMDAREMLDVSMIASLAGELASGKLSRRRPFRVPGVAIFLTSVEGGAPPVLLHHLKHNKVLHERVILMSVVTEEIPLVDEEGRDVSDGEIGELACRLLDRGLRDRPGALRLVGVGVSGLSGDRQLTLYEL